MGPSILFNIVFFQFLLPHGCRFINSTQESVFGTVFDDNLKAAVVAGKAPLDALTMDTKLGERYREFQQLLRQELDEARAEASAAARAEAQQGATQDPEAQEGLPVRSAAFKAFLGDVQAKIGEIKNEETLAQLQYFEDKARNLMASNVQLFVFQPSENELCAYFDKAAACQVRGGGNQWVGIFLDPAQWGEAVTNPHIRVCPLNQQYLKTFLASVVKSRDKQQLTLHHRDLFIYFDSFLPGNLNKVLGSFQTPAGDALNKNSFGVFISYDEESLKQRRQYIKANSTTFQQVELMTLVTAENFGDAMTKTNRKIYKGTNFGNKIGDVLLESPKLLWSMALKAWIEDFLEGGCRLFFWPFSLATAFVGRTKSLCLASTGCPLVVAPPGKQRAIVESATASSTLKSPCFGIAVL